MKLADISRHIRSKESFLCVGLDPDPDKMPGHLRDSSDPIFEFNKALIDATQEYCVAFKPNTAFYEAWGPSGWSSLLRTVRYIKSRYPQHFVIADAKRGDIGNTARQYARAFFEAMPFDAITVAPYMGRDSVEPFLEWEDKFVVLLALTSNEGARDYQLQPSGDCPLFERVVTTSSGYRHADRLMYVVGATQTDHLRRIRELLPDSFLLLPGVGSQGGSVEEACRECVNAEGGILINVSRSIVFASTGEDFASAAAKAAWEFREPMRGFARKKH